jgi:hypothetical protein
MRGGREFSSGGTAEDHLPIPAADEEGQVGLPFAQSLDRERPPQIRKMLLQEPPETRLVDDLPEALVPRGPRHSLLQS